MYGKNGKCVKDNKQGHFVKVRLSVQENVAAIMAGNPNKQGEINSNKDGYNNGFCKKRLETQARKPWSEEVKVRCHDKFKLDSGMDVTVIGDSIYSLFFNKTKLEETPKEVFGSCKSKLDCLGMFRAKLPLNRKSNDEHV